MNIFSKAIILIIALFILPLSYSYAQEKFTLSGFVKDGSNGETLIGAGVFVSEINQGTAANQYGFYSLTLDKGTYNVKFSFLSFKDTIINVVLDKNIRLNVDMA